MRTGEFVEFETEGDGEEEKLVGNGDQQGDGEVVVVKGVDGGHDDDDDDDDADGE